MPSASPEKADNVKIDDEIGRFSSAHRAMLSGKADVLRPHSSQHVAGKG